MELDELYSDIILEYSRSKKHNKKLLNPLVVSKGINPSCGDNLELELKIENDVIVEVGTLGTGCAISQASTAMMAEMVEGNTISNALILVETFIGMIQKKITGDEDLEILEDAIALKNISNMPARVKCAVLAWHTLEDAIKKAE